MDIVKLREEWVPFFESVKNEEPFVDFLANPTHPNAMILSSFLESTGRIDWYKCGETRGVFGTHEGIVFKFPIFRDTLNNNVEINDYCKMEVRHYRAARKAGLDSLFAACDRLCWLQTENGYYPIYVMDEVSVDGEENLDVMLNWYTENNEEPDAEDIAIRDYEVKYDEINSGSCEGVAIYLAGFLGRELYEEFDEFCFQNDITDIHNENFGFVNGQPVIIDYAGFGEQVFMGLPADWFSKYGL